MSRRQQQNGRRGGSRHHHANELLNFHFSTPAETRRENSSSNRSSGDYHAQNRRGGNHGRNHKNNPRRSAQHRASVRQTANSSMFHLHSSAEHTFLLTRRSPSKVNQNDYSFYGSDHSVSWESVRMVQQRVPCSDEVCCPICLCDFVSARISKCGHSFCLSCILRHVQTYAANNPYHPIKCPCCGIPLVVEDMRPVSFEAVRPVVLQQSLKLRKLHRQKASSSPFLPIPGAHVHSNPHFAPIAGIDADARYSRFNYLDPDAYHATLVANQGELEREARETVGAGLGNVSTEKMYLDLALGMVMAEQQKAHQQLEEETALMARFAGSNSGMYQAQSPAFVYTYDDHDAADGSASFSNLSLHDTDESALPNESWSEHGDSSIPGQRYRGDSICSYKSVDTASTPCSNHEMGRDDAANQKRSSRRHSRKKLHGSMYLDTENAVHLYQAEDGQLVFLNGFNMTCLLSDFSKGPPSTDSSPDANNHPRPAAPLPDVIEGRVLEKEHVHLTSETRKRMPFLNHIPLYTDIVFVELDLNHLLSEGTRRKFKNEIDKRRKKRQSKTQAEKRADRIARKEDQERINERKARLQLVDPDDEFFHAAVQMASEPAVVEAADFGPLPAAPRSPAVDAALAPTPASSSSFSFSQAAQRGSAAGLSSAEAFPELSSSRAFPTLGSPTPAASRGPSATTWGSGSSAKMLAPSKEPPNASGAPGGGKKKKKKGQKLVLFSTGGSRGYY
eukprot:jgi/Psemu1/54304/gm1.54304_g